MVEWLHLLSSQSWQLQNHLSPCNSPSWNVHHSCGPSWASLLAKFDSPCRIQAYSPIARRKQGCIDLFSWSVIILCVPKTAQYIFGSIFNLISGGFCCFLIYFFSRKDIKAPSFGRYVYTHTHTHKCYYDYARGNIEKCLVLFLFEVFIKCHLSASFCFWLNCKEQKRIHQSLSTCNQSSLILPEMVSKNYLRLVSLHL